VLKYKDLIKNKNTMIHRIKTKIREHRARRALKKAQKREAKQRVHDEPSAFDHAVISWTAQEYIKHEKGLFWKVCAVIFIAVFAAFGFMEDAWTFSLAIIVFGVTYFIVHLEHPKHVEVKISATGIKFGNRKYSYGKIKAFWIIYNPPHIKTLNIRVHGEFLTDISIQLDDQNPAVIREYLLSKIPEMEGKSESLGDAILRLLKI
jgi:hypothetical protein